MAVLSAVRVLRMIDMIRTHVHEDKIEKEARLRLTSNGRLDC